MILARHACPANDSYCRPVSNPPLSRQGHSLVMFHLVSLEITATPSAICRHRGRRFGQRCPACIVRLRSISQVWQMNARLFVTANTARTSHLATLRIGHQHFAGSEETTMSFNYLTNSSGFTRITAYVGQLLNGAVDEHIERLSQQLRPNPASRCLNRPCELSELMSRTIAP
jgi:hypothetical protein